MIALQLLEPHDVLQASDWCRPLNLMSMSGGMSDYYSFKSCYTGSPENNVKWVRVEDQLGPGWLGKTVGEFNQRPVIPYEFIRGLIPQEHQLDMRDYTQRRHR